MNKERINKILYWSLTLLVALPMLFSSYLYLSKADKILEGFGKLGYPVYLINILGTAKLLGAAALLFPKFPKLKEWAYAGFTFNFIGAFLSHILSGDQDFAGPLVFLLINSLSYFYWKKSERVPA
ncbi:DoxX family protein [Leptospira wolffii]|uniref:DoxX family protein n=1 Tax=Leptospira wolffii TaxID=409998 RepID=A0A2M9Z8Y8_9LEPT|nr:DoxX family protein [Leptospira wolffii]EPG66277.1 DoxX-like family protein [Leptospira wolffii serovar Khorat str. Khorat-H2]PJZ64875.1 DoxX family protein [Leptospira wolffii]TGL50591.1 DoxX family protein [Leptospira wolffii]